MTMAETFAYHEELVRLAAMAVDAARAAGNAAAEAVAIAQLTAADAARQQFKPLWIAAHQGDLELDQKMDLWPMQANRWGVCGQ